MTTILRAYKTELDLNNRQRTLATKHAGAARWAYNWGLARKIAAHKAGEKAPTAIDLHRALNELKRGELSWLYELSKTAPQEALRDLDRAYANFFRRAKLKKQGKLNGKVGFPHFKSKKKGLGSFRMWGSIHITPETIQLPRMGKLRLKEHSYLPVSGVKILSATVSEKAGRWFVSLQCETEISVPDMTGLLVCGVDLGIKQLAIVSDGQVFENPCALKRVQKRLKRMQRRLSRKAKGSANRKKAVRALAKAHRKVANIRIDTLHKITTRLAKTKSVIVVEDLNVSGMLKNHCVAGSIADVGMYEFRRQLDYKSKWYGSRVMYAPRFYPSSKMCSGCGTVKAELKLSEREYRCPACGLVIDRDLNAAINLERLANENTASSAGIDACGKRVSPDNQAVLAEAGTKQQTCPSLSLGRFV